MSEQKKSTNRIAELRKEKGLTLKQVGDAIGVGNSTISRYESGLREPKLATWVELADYFDVPVDYLQGLSDNRQFHIERNIDVYKTREKLSALDEFKQLFLNPINFTDGKVPDIALSEEEQISIIASIRVYKSFLDLFIPFSYSRNTNGQKAVIYGATAIIQQLFNDPLTKFVNENMEYAGKQERTVQEREHSFDKFNIQMLKKIEKVLELLKEDDTTD